jgi:hypothetical protein
MSLPVFTNLAPLIRTGSAPIA